MTNIRVHRLSLLMLLLTHSVSAWEAIDLTPLADAASHWQMKYGRDREDGKRDPSDITGIATQMLLFQNPDGGWPKDLDYQVIIDEAIVRQLRGDSLRRSTLDNHSTFTQTVYLACAHEQTREERYRVAAERGIDYLLREQRPSGGWRGADVDAITFNDGTMIGVMETLQQIVSGAKHFAWLDAPRREAVAFALQRAIDATLRCQIEVNGVKTAWCQQHSHENFAPVKARAYELPSISAGESPGIIHFLMFLPNPSPEIMAAVDAAVAWFERSAIQGIRVESVPIEPVRFENHTATSDRVVVLDPSAPPLWTRYYEIETNRPFFCNRDGVKVYSLAEVALERRSGYGWYTGAPQSVLDAYPTWKAAHTVP